MKKVLLVGRPNAGKSSIYNLLTGGAAKVANFPGVTVDVLLGESELPSGERITVCDLPGLYSVRAALGAETDEGVAQAYLARCKEEPSPYLVCLLVDGSRLALGLRLLDELKDEPTLLVVTQKDVLLSEGKALDVEALVGEVSVPVVWVSTREPTARHNLLSAIENAFRSQEPGRRPEFDGARVAERVLRETHPPKGRTERLDRLLLHPFLGPVLFFSLMASLFTLVFWIADPISQWMDAGVSGTRSALSHVFGETRLTSFLADGVLGGAGTVLGFLPQIVILTVAMELLDASGYLARGAFLTERLLRVMGLGGRAFVPLLMGHACAVPAISATRSIRDPGERLRTILVLPLTTCSARIPTYGLLIATFFSALSPLGQALIFVSLYACGIASSLLASLTLKRFSKTAKKGLPLVLEMPALRAPEFATTLRVAFRSAIRFVKDVGTFIVGVSAILWLLLSVPMPGKEANLENSIAASLGKAAEPLTRPLGFDWRVNVGLLGSFGAREMMVGTLGVIFGVEDAEDDPVPLRTRLAQAKAPNGAVAYSPRTALSLLAFFVIACQCMSTVSAVRRETRSFRWPAFLVAYSYSAAYLVSLAVFQGAKLLGMP